MTNFEGLYLTGGAVSLIGLWLVARQGETHPWGPICAAILAAGFFLGAAILVSARKRG